MSRKQMIARPHNFPAIRKRKRKSGKTSAKQLRKEGFKAFDSTHNSMMYVKRAENITFKSKDDGIWHGQ